MFTVTVMDSDQWIAQGINCYFSEKHIRVRLVEQEEFDVALRIAAGSNVVISELCAFGRDVQAVTELLVCLRRVSPNTRLIILTDVREKAVISHVLSRLPGVCVLSKRSDILQLAGEVFGYAVGPQSQEQALTVRNNKEALTAREFGLLRLLATQRSLTDIGHRLQLSVKTISHHRKNIMLKLGCRTSVELSPRLKRMGFGRRTA
ncbi:LuxR C-terminal-related transcriptional regulator [Pantoea hericii]|uniref:helix-turn-helix transcriptional regulator n=1 Tax=Pantoea hericii TaxID=1815628 RepID=UPI0015FE1A76|nr:LuxR C-terminal-related transcriptional regulator [Pantoea hericii]